MENLIIEKHTIEGVFTIKKKTHTDERGFFERIYCHDELLKLGLIKPIKQINISNTSQKGVVRGMHLQADPSQENKIITCLKGSVFDVVVDLRKESPSYLKSYSTILSEENRISMVVPEGCAHGFQTLSEGCELLYFHTSNYDPSAEFGVNSLDSTLDIKWPLPINYRSKKDINLPLIENI